MNAQRIVVGFDGSPDAAAAVRWAADEAHHRGAVLDVVHAYDYPYLEQLTVDARAALHDRAAAIAEEGAAVATAARPDIHVRPTVHVGSHARALIDVADGADLLVVGHRGENHLHRWVLGSVATKCVLHATCPVAVIRRQEGVGGPGSRS